MNDTKLKLLFERSLKHQEEHHCGGHPYQHGDLLRLFVSLIKAKRVLELGTGLGYTAICLAQGLDFAQIDTIDRDELHLSLAEKNWEGFEVRDRIHPLFGKAEEVLPTLRPEYDLIFFDGYTPSMKFLLQFERLLKKDGLLITANMFLRDKTGGKYMRALQRTKRWITAVFSDTAVSVKLF